MNELKKETIQENFRMFTDCLELHQPGDDFTNGFENLTTAFDCFNQLLDVKRNDENFKLFSELRKKMEDEFLATVSARYVELMAAAEGKPIWGGDIELEQIAEILKTRIKVHKNTIGNRLAMEFGTREYEQMIELLLIGEDFGTGHYCLLTPEDNKNFKTLGITADGNCLFNACLAGIRFLKSPEKFFRQSTVEEISELRKKVCDNFTTLLKNIKEGKPRVNGEKNYTIDDDPIRSRFLTILEGEEQDVAQHYQDLPNSVLRDQAWTLRKIKLYLENISDSACKRKYFDANPDMFSFGIKELSCKRPKIEIIRSRSSFLNLLICNRSTDKLMAVNKSEDSDLQLALFLSQEESAQSHFSLPQEKKPNTRPDECTSGESFKIIIEEIKNPENPVNTEEEPASFKFHENMREEDLQKESWNVVNPSDSYLEGSSNFFDAGSDLSKSPGQLNITEPENYDNDSEYGLNFAPSWK